IQRNTGRWTTISAWARTPNTEAICVQEANMINRVPLTPVELANLGLALPVVLAGPPPTICAIYNMGTHHQESYWALLQANGANNGNGAVMIRVVAGPATNAVIIAPPNGAGRCTPGLLKPGVGGAPGRWFFSLHAPSANASQAQMTWINNVLIQILANGGAW